MNEELANVFEIESIRNILNALIDTYARKIIIFAQNQLVGQKYLSH